MSTVQLSSEQAFELAYSALLASQVSEANAQCVASALVAAQIDGQQGHGLSRVPSYCAQSRTGKVDGFAKPALTQAASAFARVDAANGFAFPAVSVAIDTVTASARQHGIAGATIFRSHHCGQLGAHVERLANEGLVAIMVANTPKAMAPWGGEKALFGTNPIAFAAPRDNEAPIIIDLSLSRVARGKILTAKQANKSIPADWALDKDGAPTTDPDAALFGSMLPAGDAKGAALALMVEVLASTVAGANRGDEATSFFDGEGDPPGVGQLMLAIDIQSAAANNFYPRMEALALAITSQDGARLPGQSRTELRAQARSDGLQIPQSLVSEIKAISAMDT
jgi:(2R)-3-sulfolactate dehydrogenase (NADP+)